MGERAPSHDDLFQQALQLDGQQREDFLAALTVQQQRWVRKQLSADAKTVDIDLQSEPILAAPTIDSVESGDADTDPTTMVAQSPEPRGRTLQQVQEMPRTIGPYKILQPIGRGGMGQVFIGEQSEPIKRRVAIKIIKTDTPSGEILARFEAERQALAMMDHQNIAKVLDAGITTDGRPYFAMELVKGIPITSYCDQNRLGPTQRLDLFVQTCRAIQHAHQKGIIHRDIKPSNVLVTLYEGKPIAKVIDFGLAKALQEQTLLTDRTLFTQYGQIVGTLEYMSPEQAEMSSIDIDTRTDVYSLGVILFELLTGSTPIGRQRVKNQAYDRILHLIREEEAPRLMSRVAESGTAIDDISEQRNTDPKRLRSLLRGDLQWIAMKALEKDRARRYDTAAALVDDIQRHLNDEPIVARPPTLVYRIHKTYRKHKAGFITGVGVACLLVAGLFGTGAMWWRAQAQATRASFAERKALLEASNSRDAELDARAAQLDVEKQRDRAITAEAEAVIAKQKVESTLARSNYSLAFARWDANRVSEAIDMLHRVPEHHRKFEWYLARRKFTGGDVTLHGHTSTVTDVCYSPDGSRLASCSWDNTIKIWDARTGSLLTSLSGHSANVTTVAFSPDGQTIASGSADNTVKIWDLESGTATTLEGHTGPVNCVCFHAHDALLASGSWDNTTKIWDLANGTVKHTLNGHGGEVFGVAFAPLGSMIASCGRDNMIRLWDSSSGESRQTLKGHRDRVTSVAFGPHGKQLVSGSFDHTVRVWDVETGKSVKTLKGHTGHVSCVTFNPDGMRIVSASDNYRQPGTIRVWNARTGAAIRALKGHQQGVTSVAFHPDGTRFASAGGYGDNTIKIWDARTGDENRTLSGHFGRATSVAISIDGKRIASGSYDRSIILWDTLTSQQTLVLDGHRGPVTCVAFSPDDSLVVSGGDDHLLKIWNPQSGELLNTLLGHTAAVSSVAVSPDGQIVASGSWDNTVRLWDTSNGTPLRQFRDHTSGVLTVAFSSSGKWLASGGGYNGDAIKITDLQTGQVLQSLAGHTNYVTAVAFSPDESRLASVSSDSTIRLWDVQTGSLLHTLQRHTNRVNDVAFNADGTRLASASYDNTVRIWDADSGEELRTLPGHTNYVTGVSFSRDGLHLVSSSWDKTIRVWDATSDDPVKLLVGHTDSVTVAAFDPGSSQLATTGEDDTIKVWDLVTGELLSTWPGRTSPVTHLGFDRDGSRILSYHEDGVRVAWDLQTGQQLADFDSWPDTPPQKQQDSPDGRWFVLPLGDQVRVVDLHFHQSPREKAYRHFKSAFDRDWHLEQAVIAENAQDWLVALFHRARIVKQDPSSNEDHWRMRMVLEKLRESNPDALANLPAAFSESIEIPEPPLNESYAEKFNFTILRRVSAATNDPITEVSMNELSKICQRYNKAAYYHTLGIAQFRAGQYERASESLYISFVQIPMEFDLHGPHPGDLAFLAMCHLKTGNREAAQIFRDELNSGITNGSFSKDQLQRHAKDVLREVDQLFAAEQELSSEG